MSNRKLSFQWDIRNFDDCDLVFDEFFESPRFSITDDSAFMSNWKLRLYPAGLTVLIETVDGTQKTQKEEKQENVSLLLQKLDSGPDFHIKFSISILNRNLNRILSTKCSKARVTSKFAYPTEKIKEATETLQIENYTERFLDDGTLSVLCEIQMFEKYDDAKLEPIKHLQMRGISWVIKNENSTIDLQLIGKPQRFFLPYGKLVIHFELTQNPSRQICLHIIDELYPEIKVHVKFVYKTKEGNWKLSKTSGVTHEPDYYDQGHVLQISSRCMVESIADALPSDLTPSLQKMKTDFRIMFMQPEFGDITIAVDGKTLRAHKDILSGRCPVFAAMFSQEWQEQKTQVVTIKDFDFETVFSMIEYIYYGGDDDAYDDTVDIFELLNAAHMYQLDHLKSKCEQQLCTSLHKENVVNYIAISDTFDLPKLKIEALAFLMNGNQIMSYN